MTTTLSCIAVSVFALLCSLLQVAAAADESRCPTGVVWKEARSELTMVDAVYREQLFGTVGGLPYDRLPKDAQPKVRPAIWELSEQSAGLAVAFTTNASSIHVDYNCRSSRAGREH